MKVRPRALESLVVLALGLAASLSAQSGLPGTIYRVFLKDGQALPSYGEAARVEDRLVFNLLIHRAGIDQHLQLISLPVAAVDLDRTSRYAEAMRAGFYAATRGEADYTAMRTDVRTSLDQLAKVEDRRRRLQLAEQARQRVLTWSRESYGYRETDVRELVGLFEALLTELRTEVGEAAFSFDLVAGAGSLKRESLLPLPTARESIALALAAARAADIAEERLAILRGAAAAVAAGANAGDLARTLDAELTAEVRATSAYTALATEFRTRASQALGVGDAAAIDRLRTELAERDRQLGERRPTQVAELIRELQAKLNAALAHRVALDHYAYVRASLLGYERRVRPALSGLDGLQSVLVFIRDLRSMAFERVDIAATRLQGLQADAETVQPPADLAAVHANLVSALRMAREAVTRRRHAVITNSAQADREASAAAAGAMMLVERARADLVAGLYPPKPQ